MSGFQKALDSIKNGIQDLAELNVKTFTGDIKIDAANVKDMDMDAIFANSGANLKVEVVGITDMKLDGDINQFVSSNTNLPAGTFTAHNKAVETGQRTRQAMLELFAEKTKAAIATLS